MGLQVQALNAFATNPTLVIIEPVPSCAVSFVANRTRPSLYLRFRSRMMRTGVPEAVPDRILAADRSNAMSVAMSTRFGPYEILDKIGAGGMGEVYRAKDTRLERQVAIKVMNERFVQDPQALARFHREAKSVAALSHPNIMAIYDVGSHEGRTFAVMELLEGQTLSARKRKSPLDWQTSLNIAIAVADGLAAAHRRGVIHRDLKPDNIFLTSDGRVKIVDFGLARFEAKPTTAGTDLGAPVTELLQTQTGVVMGTLTYMSPEQVRGEPTDARTDVFAFGCVLYELLNGRRTFAHATSPETMVAILHDPPLPFEPSADRPAEIDAIVLRCLEKSPSKRFPSGVELAASLKNAARTLPKCDTDRAASARTAVQHENDSKLPPHEAAPSVAVLPFVNMSSDRENEFFSDGLAEELIAVLSKIEGLRVASRTSSFAFKGRNEDVRKIGEQLGVRTVLEGSVRKAGNRLRILAQLVNVADGYQLWSQTYDRQLEDVFAIQDEIAHSIAQALRLILSEKDRKNLQRVATADVRAYEYYLRGRQFFHQFRRKGFEVARQMFARAIEIDPVYALAYAGIADCHSLLYTYWDTTDTNLREANAASLKALELAPQLAEAHVARGLAVSLNKQFDDACREFETALQLDPILFEAYYFYGRACLAQGKPEDAVRWFEAASKLRPDDYRSDGHLVSLYVGLGRRVEAETTAQRCLRVLEKHLHLHPDDARAVYLGAVVWTQVGNTQRAIEWAGQALTMDPEEPLTLYNVACVYALQNQAEQALDCLEQAVSHGFRHKEWVEHDSDLAALRELARFEALLDRLS
jgi:non-specific serine/threonine protein kinase